MKSAPFQSTPHIDLTSFSLLLAPQAVLAVTHQTSHYHCKQFPLVKFLLSISSALAISALANLPYSLRQFSTLSELSLL